MQRERRKREQRAVGASRPPYPQYSNRGVLNKTKLPEHRVETLTHRHFRVKSENVDGTPNPSFRQNMKSQGHRRTRIVTGIPRIPLWHTSSSSLQKDGETLIAGQSCIRRFAVFVINYLARCAYSVKSFATLSPSVVVATSIPYARITARSLFWCALRNSLGIVRSSYRSA